MSLIGENNRLIEIDMTYGVNTCTCYFRPKIDRSFVINVPSKHETSEIGVAAERVNQERL